MASKKEIEAAQKAAKKTIIVGKKEEEKKKVERQTTSVEARISSSTTKEIEQEPQVKVIKTKAQQDLEEIELLREQLEIERKKEKARKNKNEGDVKIGEEITFFDPDLSYELTGYRPITMTKGLDFDPKLFTEAGRIYDETGKYCTFRIGSKLYDDFWDVQMDRCKNGYTIGKYTLTGDNYF
jgi:flagellar biosynthesis GTPase FlhF